METTDTRTYLDTTKEKKCLGIQNNLNCFYFNVFIEKKQEKNVRMLISLWQEFSPVENKL